MTAHDIYELVVGEIGVHRNTFLYDLVFWEVRRIIRGYRRRDRTTNQLLAECVYATTFSMQSPNGRTVKDMFPSLFEDDDEPAPPPITEEEILSLQEEMRQINSISLAEAHKSGGVGI